MRTTAQDIINAYPNSAPIAQNIVDLAKKLEMGDAAWLANLINFETGSTFSPSKQNPQSNATGLIQFMPSTASGLGTSVDALKNMTAQQQWFYVEKYLMKQKNSGSSFKDPTDVYMAVFYPAAMGKGRDFSIADHYARDRGKNEKGSTRYQQRYDYLVRINNGIKTAGDYADFANKNAKMPTGLGVRIPKTNIRVMPILGGLSFGLLILALILKNKE